MSTVKATGVVGAGTMGSGIAQKLAQEGFRVVLVDVDETKVQAGLTRVRASLDEAVTRRIFDRARADAALARIEATSDWSRLGDVDLVVEAVFEDLKVKKDVFERLDASCRPDAILGTNTSSFPVGDLARATRHPERVLGLHFFYHPAKNRLVEVVPHRGTSPEAFERAWIAMERSSKLPIRSEDSPGFVVNRFFVPWLNEAVRLLEGKVARIPTIEAAAKEAFGIGMGPFELMNVTGIPIAYHSCVTLGGKFGKLYAPAPLLEAQMKSGKLWDLGGDVEPDCLKMVRQALLGTVFLVAGEILDEKIARPEDLDLGARVGLRWAKGPLELANSVGTNEASGLAELAGLPFQRMVPDSLAQHASAQKPFALEQVRLSVAGDLATITLDRPDALNALDESVVAELAAKWELADANPAVRGVLIRGRGKAFVAGADVKWFVKQLDKKDVPGIVAFTRRGQELFARFARSKKVVVAALEGLSLGGGSELALACDYIVATERGTLGFPETGIGIYPGLGGTQRLPRRVGRGLARYLVYTGRVLSAQDAVSVGAMDVLVAPEDVLKTARELVARGKPVGRAARDPLGFPAAFARAAKAFDVPAPALATLVVDDPVLGKEVERVKTQKAPIALALADELVAGSSGWSLEQGLEEELGRLPKVFATKDAYEGLSTLGRTRPRFVGA